VIVNYVSETVSEMEIVIVKTIVIASLALTQALLASVLSNVKKIPLEINVAVMENVYVVFAIA